MRTRAHIHTDSPEYTYARAQNKCVKFKIRIVKNSKVLFSVRYEYFFDFTTIGH